MLKKEIWDNFQRIIELLPKKALKNMGLGSGIEIMDPEIPIPDPGSWIQGSKRCRIPDPQHCSKLTFS